MATDEDYPIDLPILVIEAQIFVAVKKFPFLPNKLIPSALVQHSQPLLQLTRLTLGLSLGGVDSIVVIPSLLFFYVADVIACCPL